MLRILFLTLCVIMWITNGNGWMSKREQKLYRWDRNVGLTKIVPIVLRNMLNSKNDHAKEKAKQMFYHGYNNYIQHAYPYDELKPLSCTGQDTWGSYSLTLVDALDTLLIMGNTTEFERVAILLADTLSFETDINVSVFETNIRVVGGLLSAHLLSYRSNMMLEKGWPCEGPLLQLAVDAAEKLLPAFDTNTSMPYGTVNFLNGVPEGETPITCTASVGTFILEFGALSYLTGDERFITAARRALEGLWKSRSKIGLVGNHINIETGAWTALDSGIGAGVDSYYEYLVKGAVLFNDPSLMNMFNLISTDIRKHLKYDDWYIWTHMENGKISLPIFQSLDAYWPGVQVLSGRIGEASRTFYNYYQVWRQYGGTPEFYHLSGNKAFTNREGYPLRPELIESAVYLYQATKDPFFLEAGRDILDAIHSISWTPCGYTTIKNIETHELDDRMESFFLAETTKYLYLLFDENNFIHKSNGGLFNFSKSWEDFNYHENDCFAGSSGYIFNTEAHPIDIASIQCCKHKHDKNSSSFKPKSFRSKDGCQRRPFHQKMFGLGTYLEDTDKRFDSFSKT